MNVKLNLSVSSSAVPWYLVFIFTMPEVPECLNRRYRALDELIQELNGQPKESREQCLGDKNTQDPGIKLMCDFWNILKEDPDCNLSVSLIQSLTTKF